MNDFFAGPLFFAVSMTLLCLGAGMLAFLIRQAWIALAFGFVGIALAVPGWLSLICPVAGIMCVIGFVKWTRAEVGRCL